MVLSLTPLYSGRLGTRLRGASENEATGESWREAEQLRSDIVIESSGTATDGIIAGDDGLLDGDGGAAELEVAGLAVWIDSRRGTGPSAWVLSSDKSAGRLSRSLLVEAGGIAWDGVGERLDM